MVVPQRHSGRRHRDSQHNNIHCSDTQHNDSLHEGLNCDSITTLGKSIKSYHVECHYAECCGTVVEQLVRNPEIGDSNPATGNGRDKREVVSSIASGGI
jgi:hypothetical protein